jgi:hypothetical protein
MNKPGPWFSGKVEEKTSYGLTAILTIPVSSASIFSEWCFRGPGRHKEDQFPEAPEQPGSSQPAIAAPAAGGEG